jgi:hypothetical protein
MGFAFSGGVASTICHAVHVSWKYAKAWKRSRQKSNAVILSGGEAGARDLTSLDVIDAVDGNAYDACSAKTLSTASLAYTVVRSFEWLAPSSG